jgi:hypothetical protein
MNGNIQVYLRIKSSKRNQKCTHFKQQNETQLLFIR